MIISPPAPPYPTQTQVNDGGRMLGLLMLITTPHQYAIRVDWTWFSLIQIFYLCRWINRWPLMNEQSKKLLWVSICLRPLVSLPACFNFLPTEQAVKYALSLPPQCIISSLFFMYSHKINTRSNKELYFIIYTHLF